MRYSDESDAAQNQIRKQMEIKMIHEMKNRLILLEGLPGTGKSTNSFRLYEQLIRNGMKAHWIHEVSQPHPTLFFTESCMTKEEYQDFTKKYPENL